MKKLSLLTTLLIAATTASAQTVAQKAEGNYSGILYVQLDEPLTDESMPIPQFDENDNPVFDENGEMVPVAYNVKIASLGDNTVQFGLYNFGFGGLDLGDIVLNDVPVMTQPDGKIVFGNNNPVFFHFIPEIDGGIEATAKINEANSYIDGDYAYIDVDVIWINGDNMPIYVRFIGNEPTKTGINVTSLRKSPAAANAYDLSGRRISGNNKRGIQISKDRKTIR